jgi:hypothetical protein
MDEMLLRSALRAGPDCPPIEVLNARLTGVEGNEARAIAELHLKQCLHCTTEMDLLREFEAGTIRPDEAASVDWIANRLQKGSKPPVAIRAAKWRAPWRMPKLLFGFASVVLVTLAAVGISSEWRLRHAETRPVPEFGDGVQRGRSVEIVENPANFQWKPVPGATRYDLIVRSVDGSEVFHNSFTGTSLAFPAEVGALVNTGKLIEWEVVARDSAGSEIATSGVQRLRRSGSLTP